MAQKVASKKSKELIVVYFGSDDTTDMPTELEYKAMLDRFTNMRPNDIPALPLVIAGVKTFRIKTERVILTPTDVLTFVPSQSKRAPKEVTKDSFFKRASTQLELTLDTGKPGYVLVPYYLQAKIKKV